MYIDHDFQILGLSPDAKPEEVGPAYLARARELALVIQNGDIVAVSRAIEELHELHDAYPKALEASERLVVLMRNYDILRSPGSAREDRILAGLSFVSGADERHLPLLEDVFCDEDNPEPVRKEAGVKMHRMEGRSDYTHRGPIIMLEYRPSLDMSSYSNLSDKTVQKMARAPFLPETVRDFAGSRVLTRLLVKWHNTVLDHEQVKDALGAVAGDEGYTASTRADARALVTNVARRANASTRGAPKWRPDTLAPGPQPGAPKIPRPQ
ncbi:hypothetical protein H0O01_05200 [Candidatus Micrarchaeota archaeon]|nr:hypothetical protein [Candidatus Micrarchaeota archaeon]